VQASPTQVKRVVRGDGLLIELHETDGVVVGILVEKKCDVRSRTDLPVSFTAVAKATGHPVPTTECASTTEDSAQPSII
jgi:hypothetical protein